MEVTMKTGRGLNSLIIILNLIIILTNSDSSYILKYITHVFLLYDVINHYMQNINNIIITIDLISIQHLILILYYINVRRN